MVSIVMGHCLISRTIIQDIAGKKVFSRINRSFLHLTNSSKSVRSKNKTVVIQPKTSCTECMLLQSRALLGSSRKLQCQNRNNKISLYGSSSILSSGYFDANSCHKRSLSSDTSQNSTTEFFPVKLAEDYILAVHDFTGLPWWASIILCTVTLRTLITLPLFIVAQRNIARYANVNKDMVEVSQILKAEVFHFSRNQNLSLEETKKLYSQQVKKQLTKKIEEHNCHPARSFLVALIQLPAWMSMSVAIRNMSGFRNVTPDAPSHMSSALSDGGILWFTDLTIPDPLFIFPCLMGVTNLVLTEMHWLSMDSKITSKPIGMRITHNLFRVLSLWLMYIATTMPSSLVLYWFTSSLFGAIQYVVLQQPRVRRAVRIPAIDGESSTPMKDMAKAARIKYLRQKL